MEKKELTLSKIKMKANFAGRTTLAMFLFCIAIGLIVAVAGFFITGTIDVPSLIQIAPILLVAIFAIIFGFALLSDVLTEKRNLKNGIFAVFDDYVFAHDKRYHRRNYHYYVIFKDYVAYPKCVVEVTKFEQDKLPIGTKCYIVRTMITDKLSKQYIFPQDKFNLSPELYGYLKHKKTDKVTEEESEI